MIRSTLFVLLLIMFSRFWNVHPSALRGHSPTINKLTSAVDDHHYFRPSGSQVSGFPPPNSAPNHRSPCPALNSLANHGFLPRNGKNLTPQLLHQVFVDVFHLDDGLAQRLTDPLPSHLTLADLSVHGFIEHDASLAHDDTVYRRDPSLVNNTLADALFARSQDGKLNKHTMAAERRARESQCKKENPKYELPLKGQAAAYGESSLLLLAMGDYNSQTISVEHAKSFLVDERIPDDFRPSETPITTATAFYLAAQIKLLAALDWSDAAME
ncbi:hypothetical protein PHYBOEH_003775 [Phytophthora boehmeriae]|uniref:Heme haloperoxidase family profile domain-containing protein n=1 Tax=Phytophthora boehmeriae TaxID=109152 RepID=A0A8T1WPQ3_9STRA|nr:hypothetical protein PHYBOEH_003775 [Phytophthora boehmeriae]